MGASTIKIPGIIDPVVLESLVCREALALAADFICNKILVSSYCKSIIEDINGRFGGINATIIKQIELSKGNFMCCSFIHEGRQSNIEAHSLEKYAFGLFEGHHLWLISPHVTLLISCKHYRSIKHAFALKKIS
jgi:hypothetical protein